MMVIRSLVRFASKLAKRCRNIMRAHIIASGAFRRLFQEDKFNRFFFLLGLSPASCLMLMSLVPGRVINFRRNQI